MKRLVHFFRCGVARMIATALLFCAGVCFELNAQRLLTGKILDTEGNPIDFATVSQLALSDSTFLVSVMTDQDGSFSMQGKDDIESSIYISAFGHTDYTQILPKQGNVDLAEIRLYREMNINLDEVSITAFRPRFELKSDRYVMNVQSLPAIKGYNIMDVLKQTPFLHVGANGGLSMVGKQEVTVYINGRRSMFDGQALAQYLKNTPAENIKNIEVITNPNSTFRAEGNFGVVNIVLKREEWEGVRGTLRFTDTQTKYNNRPGGNLNLNLRKRKIMANINVYGGLDEMSVTYYTKSRFLTNATVVESNIRSDDGRGYLGGSLNMDYQINDHHTLGLIYNSSSYENPRREESLSEYFSDGAITPDSLMQSTVDRKNPSINHALNLNYFFKTNPDGGYLSVDADYYYRQAMGRSLTVGNIIDRNYQILRPYDQFTQRMPVYIDNWAGKAEYYHIFNPENKLTTGINVYGTQTDNTDEYMLWDGTAYHNDMNRSNHFIYEEIISAAYLSYKRNWSKSIETTLGLRLEHNYNHGNQKATDETFTNKYINLFPSFFINYKGFLSYSLSNRIRRPSLRQLNPFRIYQSANSYTENNPHLKPINTWMHDLSFVIRKKYIVRPYLNIAFNDWAWIVFPEEGNVTRSMYVNYDRATLTGLALVQNEQLFNGLWQMNNTFSWFYSKIQGNLDDITLNNSQHSLRLMLNHTLWLSKKNNWSADVSFYYQSPVISVNTRVSPMSSLNLSLNKQIKNVNIRLWIDDLYHGRIRKSRYVAADLELFGEIDYASHAAGFSLSYNFGNQKVSGTRNRSVSNDDIKNRAR